MLIPEPLREFLRRHVMHPLLRLLRRGVTPRRLAWSLALGMIIGINPSVGITSAAVILIAWAAGLNKMASLIGAHLVAPLHLLLFIPFIEVGVHVFRTGHMPMTRRDIEHLSHHPVRLFRTIWQWEWHALVVWAILAACLTPLIARFLRRGLVVFMRRHRTLLVQTPAARP